MYTPSSAPLLTRRGPSAVGKYGIAQELLSPLETPVCIAIQSGFAVEL